MIDKFFQLKGHNTTVRREITAGSTTFMTMAYLLVVIPTVLSLTGMDKSAVFTAVAIASMFGTLLMALMANLPIALGPGLGLNAFFAYTVVLTMGYSWQFALAGVFIEGLLFILLTMFNIREAIVKAIPYSLKISISVGIGLFITIIGLLNSGIIVQGTPFSVLGNLKENTVLLAVIAVITNGILLIRKVKGALLIGIVLTTLIGIPMNITTIPDNFQFFSLPPSIEPVFFKMDFSNFLSMDMLIIVLTFIFMDIFDTAGTLIGVCAKSGLLTPSGDVPKAKQAFFADAIATTLGAVLGTSTITTYIESTAGVAAGGRTGLSSVVTSGFFLFALFAAPLFAVVPAAATSATLVLVGLFMMSLVTQIDFEDYHSAIPAFITIIITPLTFSIANGIMLGVIAYVLLNTLTGGYSKIRWPMYILSFIFLLRIVFLL